MPKREFEPEETPVDTVLQIWRLGQLAAAWTANWRAFAQADLNELRTLAQNYRVDVALLLYQFQQLTAVPEPPNYPSQDPEMEQS